MRGSLDMQCSAASSRDARRGIRPADDETDERGLILRYRNGDTTAFAGFVELYRAPVYGYLVRCRVDAADRDDLFQEIFLRIHAASARYRAELPVHPWVFTIVANTVRTHLRKGRLRALIFTEPGEIDAGVSEDESERVAARQTLGWLEGEIRRLPPAHRQALVLVAIEGLTLKEAAAALGLPVNTVKTHLRRARLRLIERLAELNRNGRQS